MRAARHAWGIGRDLTHYVVIDFDQPEPGWELQPQRQMNRIRVKARAWWDYKRRSEALGPLTDLRTWENSGGILHVNWLIHLPAHLVAEFGRKLEKWVQDVANPTNATAIKMVPIYNLNGLARYVLKGTEPGHAHRFGIDASDQGVIWGRRASASFNLGRAARANDKQAGRILRTSKRRRQSPRDRGQPRPQPGL